MKRYDYIILGAGAAGLLLAKKMSEDAFFSSKSILLIDKDTKQINDRTWCFWETKDSELASLVHKTWEHIYVAGATLKKSFPIAPYTYKMIRGEDFYNTHLAVVKANKNATILFEEVESWTDVEEHVVVKTTNFTYEGTQVFNSIFDYQPLLKQQKYPVLQQHFLGWFIKTETPVFNENEARFMDFSIPQQGNTRFMYVLPNSPTEALVEYTLFSKKTLSNPEYEEAISSYMKTHYATENYTITEKEQGSIPMTCYNFGKHNTKNVMHIGIAGGWAKASTGYTFMRTVKKTNQLIMLLKNGKSLQRLQRKDKFWGYDLLLLNILNHDNSKGQYIFETLFKNAQPQAILKFLDEDTSLWEDLKIILNSPKKAFTKALLRQLF